VQFTFTHDTPPRRVLTPLVAAALTAVVALVTFVRIPETARNTMWADDASRFVGENIRVGLLESLAIPYGGYLQFVPRIGGWVALRAGDFPGLARDVTIVSCGIAGLFAALVFVLSRQFVRHLWVRVLIGLVPAFVPTIPMETAGNLANLHWYVLVATPFLFAFVPRHWVTGSLLGIAALLMTLSETQTLVFVPLLLIGVNRIRKTPVIVGAVLGLATQLISLGLAPRTGRNDVDLGALDIVAGYLVQPFAGTWTTDAARVGSAVIRHGWWVVAVPFAAVVVVVALGFWRGLAPQRIMLASMVVGSAASWAAPLLITPSTGFLFSHYTIDQFGQFHVVRYTAVSSMFIMMGLLIVVDIAAGSRWSRAPRWLGPAAGAALTATLVISAVVNFTVPWSTRDSGPLFNDGVTTATQQCIGQPSDTTILIPAAPNPNWKLAASCAYVQP
jgi:hypothetical protein